MVPHLSGSVSAAAAVPAAAAEMARQARSANPLLLNWTEFGDFITRIPEEARFNLYITDVECVRRNQDDALYPTHDELTMFAACVKSLLKHHLPHEYMPLV
jgi:hypothetical protein